MKDSSIIESYKVKNLYKLTERLKLLYIPILCVSAVIILCSLSIIINGNTINKPLCCALIIINTIDFSALSILSILISHFKTKYESHFLIDLNELEKIVEDRTDELKSIYKALPDQFCQIDREGCILRIPNYPKSSNKKYSPSVGGNIIDFLPENSRKDVKFAITRAAEENITTIVECDIPSEKQGKSLECRFAAIDCNYITCAIRDITKQKEFERGLYKSLHEQEILMKEVHHRVKNNLMLIISLINFYDDPDRSDNTIHFTDLKNRIFSISLIFEKLYNKELLSRIEFNDYISDLTGYLLTSFNRENINLRISIPSIFLTPEKVVPLGLITSEIVSIALKQWPEKNMNNLIEIKFDQKDDEIILNYHFNYSEFIDILQIVETESVGINLIQLLTEQINGSIDVKIENDNNKKVALKFPA